MDLICLVIFDFLEHFSQNFIFFLIQISTNIIEMKEFTQYQMMQKS